MHFPLWIFFSIYCDICGITVFVGCPSSNANATADLDEDTAFLPLLAWCGSNDKNFNWLTRLPELHPGILALRK